MELVDVHCHLDFENFDDDRDEVVKNASEEGVRKIICNGTNPESNRRVLEISENYEMVEPALGIYPNDGLELGEEEISEELSFIEEQDPVAIGECGLDFKEEVDEEKMKSVFEKQVQLAKELDVPVIVHSRSAEEEVIELLESFTYDKVVMHCFSGNKNEINRVIDNDWYFSIPTIVTRLEHFQMVADMVSADRILTETDAPFLSPYPNVDRNEPGFVKESLQKIAEVKGLAVMEMADRVLRNYKNLFS